MKVKAFITLVALGALIVGCSKSETSPEVSTSTGGATTGQAAPGKLTELKTETLEQGKGELSAENGDMLTMLYRGTLANGTVFDGNMDENHEAIPDKDPFALTLGMNMVIQGWEKGLIGIKVGEIRRISIPSELGYGSADKGTIPPNSDLYFDVKCLDIIKKGEEKVIDTEDIKVGTGAPVKSGDTVEIHYVGKLLNGKQFDSSRDRKQAFTFKVGAQPLEVVPGFDKGVQGMRKGGIRKLRLPPQTAYGAEASGALPGNSVLNFEIELLKINGK